MSEMQSVAAATQGAVMQRVVNRVCINVATANGTGSQTSNIALFRAMFRMGIPVSGKNLFPSNIQGLPTWYRIRVDGEGFTGYRDEYDILVAMNKDTLNDDLAGLASGGVVLYDEALGVKEDREDLIYYRMPVRDLVKGSDVPATLRGYIANMVYVGVMAELFGIEMSEIRSALMTHFSGKQKAVDQNMQMVEASAAYARDNLPKRDPYVLERIEGGNQDLILVEGNTAAALGAIYGGMTVAAWYPITPATSLADGLNEYLPQLRKDPESGKATYMVIQAEDELAAAGMTIGAGWAGARAMTSTSGPGISLMAEFAGLAYFAEIPTVIWDVQRVGPSTGLPTRTSQGDLRFVYHLGHGDTSHIVLLPHDPAECFEFGYLAFDYSEQFQTPVFVLSDLDIGMNLWMTPTFAYPEKPMNRGKVLSAEKLHELKGHWARYADVDHDGIAYRTLPGTDHPLAGYFTRGTGHNEKAAYSERPADWEANLQRLHRKHQTARRYLPSPILIPQEGADIGLISFGSNHPSILEALTMLKRDGMTLDYLRVRALPLAAEISAFVERFDRVYVIENNQDGQLFQILVADMPHLAGRLISTPRFNGMPLTATWIHQAIAEAQHHLKRSTT
jgi:2-oxoglutarate ferredoxin oxidoreductase subunit alpha